VIHLYALSAAPNDLAGVPGVDGAPVETLPIEPIHALASRYSDPPFPVTVDRLVEHDAVIESAFACGPVLPVRFGSTFTDERELATHVLPRVDSFVRQLALLDGCVELALRVDFADTDPFRRTRAVTVVVEDLVAAAAGDARAVNTDDKAQGRAALLIERAAVDRVAEVLRRRAGVHPQVQVTLTGPWPPYSFSEHRAVVAP